MSNNLEKETCCCCNKSLNIDHAFLECESCNAIIHSKCFSYSKFQVVNDNWVCQPCQSKIAPRYNPFKKWANSETDKHYENDCGNDMIQLSGILDKCNMFTIQSLNDKLNDLTPRDALVNNILSSFFLNIDGNFSNFDHLQVILKGIAHTFSAIGLAETNLGPKASAPFILPGYTSYYQEIREDKKSGTGVALYVHKSLNAAVVDELSHCTKDLESIIVKITNLAKPIFFGSVYRPHDGDITAFYTQLNDIFEALPNEGCFIMGDYNIDLLRHKVDNIYEEAILTNGFHPLVSLSTHEKPNCKPSCIDNIHSNETDSILVTGTLSDRISHHLPILQFSDIDSLSRDNKIKQTKVFDYSNKNVQGFINELQQTVPNLLPSTNFSDFTELFESTLNKHCKLDKPKVTKRTSANNPWITDGLIESIKRKHELKNEWINTKSKKCPNGNPILHKKFLDYQLALRNLIKEAKRSHTIQKFAECKEDRKKTWGIINDLRGKSKDKLKPPFIINSEKVTNRRIIANEFNKYFISIASKLNSTISDTPLSDQRIPSFYDYLNPPNKNSMVLYDTDPDEVMGIIKELSNGKASDIPIKIIKKAAPIIVDKLSEYYTILMHAGIFPDNLKIGKISPIFKKGDSELLENYRPISTLPIFGKIFEKIIYVRLYSFFTSQNILYDKQFGFRKSHSTSHAINHSVTHVTNELRQKKYVLGIFIDLSKAFYTIDHSILIRKLDRYGVRGSPNALIKSYLSNRQQYTQCLDEQSDLLEVEFGVPQGSVLGPLLFLIYINDIINSSPLGNFVLFADDTNIFVSGSDMAEAYSIANTVLEALNNYMVVNKLHINMTKCCYILFKPKSKQVDQPYQDFNLKINGTVIKQVTHTKFLGVTIDEDLNWDHHITDLKRNLYYALSTINRIKHFVPIKFHKDLYYTLFESRLCYCISAWGMSQKTLDKIHVIQKKMIRILFGDTEAYKDKFRTCSRTRVFGKQRLGSSFYCKEHTKPLFEIHQIMSVHNLYSYHCFMEVFRILKFQSPPSLFYQYRFSQRNYLTHIVLNPPTPSDHFIYRSSVLWNQLRKKLELEDISVSSSRTKAQLRSMLHSNQHKHDKLEWLSTHDFNINIISKSQ